MIKRVVEISSGPASLSLRTGQMIISKDGEEVGQAPIEDLGTLVIDHRLVTYTNALLCALLENNVSVMVCGENHHPVGLFLPMEANTVHAEVIALQAEAGAPLKKRLWKDIIVAKIKNQAYALQRVNLKGDVLLKLADGVTSGDPDNIEGRAAHIYWQRLFGEDFRRDRYGETPNNFLNYGYAILRASVARAICSAGLHPSLGIHHRNKYNAFALADDLMEPMRPMVDVMAFGLWREGKTELSKEEKAKLLGLPSMPVERQGQSFPLLVFLHRYTASLKRVFSGEDKVIEFPDLRF